MPASLLRSGGLVGFTEQWPFRVIQQSAFFLALFFALSLTEKDRLRRLSRICKTVSSPSSFLARPFPIPIQSPPRRSPSSKKKCTSWSRFDYLFSVSLSLSLYVPPTVLRTLHVGNVTPNREPPLTSCDPVPCTIPTSISLIVADSNPRTGFCRISQHHLIFYIQNPIISAHSHVLCRSPSLSLTPYLSQ